MKNLPKWRLLQLLRREADAKEAAAIVDGLLSHLEAPTRPLQFKREMPRPPLMINRRPPSRIP